MSSTVRVRVEAPVMEVFASIQGEGRYIGEPQVFLRLRGCPLRCRWCDTPGSWAPEAGWARIVAAGEARREPSLATPFQAACWIAEAEPGAPRTLSVTGGEPLLWPDFLLGLREVVGPRRLHLETAGAHPEALARVLRAFDHVSLDLKLPADMEAPVPMDHAPLPADENGWRAARRACLGLVRGRDAAAKIIVSGGRRASDYRALVDDAAELAPGIALIVQPVTPSGTVRPAPVELVLEVAELARASGLDARVLPQIHRRLELP